ncbi:ABC transporter permease [Fulvivirga sp.]|uniref:ABC transporter permease n=2 Tax=Fulvivirga sp. TaxID=1931237 RepID=UPI0032EE8C92
MIRNYLKIAFRNLIKNKVFTTVNILGLAFGIACFAFISLWVWDELRQDQFHDNGDNIFQLFGEVGPDGERLIRPYFPSAMVEPIIDQLPEVEKITRVFPSKVVFSKDAFKFSESGLYVDSSFLKIFNFPLKEGVVENIFRETHSVVISAQLAEKYFPGESALGKYIEVVQKEKQQYIITGVLKSLPGYSSLSFDYLLPYDKFEAETHPWWGKSNRWAFTNYNITAYAQLQDNINTEDFEAKLNSLFQKYVPEETADEIFIYPFEEVYLHSDFSNGRVPTGRIEYVKLLFFIALIVLLIACINFINLSTAIAHKRAKEVSLRKTAGAKKGQIVFQFLTESIIISAFAFIIAIAFVEVLMPSFNLLTQKAIVVPFSSVGFILLLVGSALIIGLLAGIYPAFFLSSFDVAKTLKSNGSISDGLKGLRKGLVIFQFTLSIVFIVFTLLVFDQIDFIQNKELGIRKNNIVRHALNGIRGKQDTYKSELLQIPGVESVTFTEQDPFGTDNANAGVFWQGKPEDTDIFFNVIQVDQDFTETFEIEILEGKAFEKNNASDQKTFLVNESAARAIMTENPIGMDLTVWGHEGKIVGLIKDYHHQSLAQAIEPVVIICNPPETWNAFISIAADQSKKDVLKAIQSVYSKYEDEYVFEYNFVDDLYQQKYSDIDTAGKLSSVFAVAAIIISCLGLFGLSAFVAEQKSKETSIRKVLGASEVSLLILFSKGFTTLVIVSFIIAAPIAFFYGKYWLSNYAYHIEVGVMPFIIAGGSAISIALLTVGYSTLKAALTKPIDVLKES